MLGLQCLITTFNVPLITFDYYVQVSNPTEKIAVLTETAIIEKTEVETHPLTCSK